MYKWIKKIFTKKISKQKGVSEKVYESTEDQDREIKELMLLQDPICGKHHG